MTESSPQHHPDALPIGTVLGDFAITGLIGEGGFGIVYLAYEATLDRTVAIKEYLPVTIAARTAELTVAVRSQNNRDAYTSGLQSFLREARMQARFSHPAMLEVYRVWEQNGTAYMAMRFYPGDTLRNLRKSATSSHVFDETAIQRIMMPVFDALGELHSESVLHRDVSPDNILIMPSGQPVLLDFGAARSVVAGAAQSLTTVLKPGYAPIEQYADDGTMEQGPWTDVYGLGAVLYFLAMGTPPPQAVTRMMGGSLHAFEASASALYSPTFIDAVTRALAVRPEARLQSVDALREALGWSWVRTSEKQPTTFIVPPDAVPSSRNLRSGQTVVSASPPAATMQTSVVGANVDIDVQREHAMTAAAVPLPSSASATIPTRKKNVALLVVGVVLAVAVIASIYLLNSGSSRGRATTQTTTPTVAPPPTAAEVASELKTAPSAPPAQMPSSAPTSAPAKDDAPTKPVVTGDSKNVVPAVISSAPTVVPPRVDSPPPNATATRPTRERAKPAEPVEPTEPADSTTDAEVASKPRGTGKTSSEVCERLLAKLSLGTDELTSTERRQLSSCR
ncbi:MAG: protein kinase [Casimicrobium sp.]